MPPTRKPDPRRANGTARNQLKKRILLEEATCHLCGQPVDKTLPDQTLPAYGELDELTPISQGGSPLDRRNVMLAHRYCNQWRGVRPIKTARAELTLEPPRFHTDGTLRTTQPTPRISRDW